MLTYSRKPRPSLSSSASTESAARNSAGTAGRDLRHGPLPAAAHAVAVGEEGPGRAEAAAPPDFSGIPSTAARLQRKAMVSTPGDPLEREADAMAERVTRDAFAGPALISPQGGSPLTQRSAADPGAAAADGDGAVRAAASGGVPLAQELRSYFEPRFGHDFGQVRIHADNSAAQAARAVQARAYTVGSDVVFGAGQYAPATTQGRRLLAHELTHVVQQGGGASQAAATVQRDKDPAAAAPAAASAIPTQPGQLTLSGFVTGSATLTPAHLAQLNQLKAQLQAKPLSAADTLLLVGHTDAVGTLERNQLLGQRRADSVQAWVRQNISTSAQLKTASLGETAPAKKADDPERVGVAENRRVEIYLQAAAPATPAALPTPASPAPRPGTLPGPRVGPLADPPGPAGGGKLPPAPNTGRINELTDLIPTIADKVKKDQFVRELRDLLVRIEPVIPKAEAKKAIDGAIGDLVDKGIKAGIMKVLQAITGRAPSAMPPDEANTHTGPALTPKDLHQQTFSVPIPFDSPPKLHRYSFEFRGLKSPYQPGSFIDFTLYTPDDFDLGKPGAKRVVLMAYDDKKQETTGEYIHQATIESKGPVSMHIQAPDTPGTYVLGIVLGAEYQASSTSRVITVEAKK